jgi:ubiquinone/menaquinone biosynthesis C-methylase UbiE
MAENWTSYDSAAECHERLAGPSFFERPARDLVADIDVSAAARIADIGTGSGVAALMASQSASPHAIVMGVDPSIEMLRTARSHGLEHVVVGCAPGLPLADRSFDRILANFVLSHLSSYELGLLDMVRLLQPGGRLGATAWGSIRNEYREFWESLAESFVSRELLAEATREGIPWDEWFSDPSRLERAFQEAGLKNVTVRRVVYRIRATIADFLAIRENALQGRFIRQHLGTGEWERFKQTAAAEFHRRFTDPIDHDRDVLIAVGTRP